MKLNGAYTVMPTPDNTGVAVETDEVAQLRAQNLRQDQIIADLAATVDKKQAESDQRKRARRIMESDDEDALCPPTADCPQAAVTLPTPVFGSGCAGAASAMGDKLPDELLMAVLGLVDTPTLLMVVPGVCRRWRNLYRKIHRIQLDFRGIRRGSATFAGLLGQWKSVGAVFIKGWALAHDDVAVLLACPMLVTIRYSSSACTHVPPLVSTPCAVLLFSFATQSCVV
jgi:hypothetical protein